MIIQAAAGFQKTQVGAEVSRSIRETNISRDQQVGTFGAAADKEKDNGRCRISRCKE